MRSTGVRSDSLLVIAVTQNHAVTRGEERWRAQSDESDVETWRERIGELVHERQELRRAGASRGSLERNRLQLVRRQSELGRALIVQHAVTAAT